MNKYFIIIMSCLLLQSCSRNPVTGKKQIVLMSESQELSLGKEADPSIVMEYGLYEDPKLQTFINTKGKEMGAISHRPKLNYEFKILDSPIVNAFAIPGGYVYFTRGIMAHFNNEAEFAGVLGHEIGHITARHGVSQQTSQLFGQLGLMGGIIFVPAIRQYADVASQGLGLLFLKFSRDHESQSDRLGVEYSTSIGYDSHEMAKFFNTLGKLSDEGGKIPTFLSTHPDPGQRNQKVASYTDEVHKHRNTDLATLKVNRDSYLKMIDGIIYGEDPKQGYFENNVFYHPELLFQITSPQGWQSANSPSQLQMAPADGKALILLQMEGGNNLQQAASKVIADNALKVVEQTNTTINGLSAISMIAEQTPEGQAQGQTPTVLRLMVTLILYNNAIYKITGISTKADFNTYFNNMQQTTKSFNKLTDQNKINKLPQRIKIVSAKRTATLQQVLQDYNQTADQMKNLSVLNAIDLNAQVQSGTLIKTLEFRK